VSTTPEALPTYPATRPKGCPFDPSPEFSDWSAGGGPQRARLGNGTMAWVVNRYEDVKNVLTDPRLSADARHYPVLNPNAQEGQPHAFPRMDGPDHLRLRRMLTGEFNARRVQRMRPDIEQLATQLLDDMISKGAPADLVRDFALPFPSLVISLLLGVPSQDHGLFQQHSNVLGRTNSTREERRSAVRALVGYLYGLVERKKQEPGDDLISRLIAERLVTGELSQQDVAMNGMILLIGGHETTSAMIGLSTLLFTRNRDLANRLRDTDDPAETADIVEELLRYLCVAQDGVFRVASEDVTIGGQLVREGELVTMNLPVANRDPDFFEDGDSFDADRATRAHLTFGYGAHACLGQSLTRAELEIALPLLLRKLPTLELAVPFESLRFRDDMSTFGVHELPVTW
jgi:cytochrome P450